jgi:mono/diheme cytochrome c family protein/plastocyanin
MNTSKQINVIVALVFLAVLATGAYTMWDPSRASDARENQTQAVVERGAWLFAQNCRTCHGDKGEGGQAANRLPAAPPLNRKDLQGVDPNTGQVSQTAKAQQFKLIVNTITCGRVGRAMPTWGQDQGGPLNSEQIRQLATLITEGTGWDLAKEFAIEGVPKFDQHGDDQYGLKLVRPVSESDTTIYLDRIDVLSAGVRLAILDANQDPLKDTGEIVSITAVNKGDNSVNVERGVGTTSPKAHGTDSQILTPPVPPGPPPTPAPTTGPACGQNVIASGPSPTPEPPATNITIVAQNIAWDKTLINALAGVPLTVIVDNRDNGIPHNIHFHKGSDASGDSIAQTEIEPGPVTQTLNFGPLEPGDYYYLCDVHPQMNGILTAVAAGGGAPPAAATPGSGEQTPVAPAAPAQ